MERIYSIIDQLKIRKRLSIEELCSTYHCSPATMRRDFVRLENLHAAKRVRGGIVLTEGPVLDYSANYRNAVNYDKKDYICGIARDFIGPGMSLFMDASSTSLRLCPYLKGIQNLTVATNGTDAALTLNDNENIETFIPGGFIKKGSHTILGGSAVEYINSLIADIAFISCRGIDEYGAYDADSLQKDIKLAMMQRSKKTLLLVDSTKFGNTFFHKLCDWNRIDAVITDCRPDENFVRTVTAAGCEVLY